MAPKETFARLLLLLAFLPSLLAGVRAQEPGNDFNVVESSFRQGDSVEVKSLRRTSESITLLVDYALESEEEAMLHLAVAGNSPTNLALDPRQQAHIKRGPGTVMLHFPHVYPGLPCVTLNELSTNRVLGHIYFGTPDDVAAARMPGVGLPSTGGRSARPFGIVQVKLVKIILPHVGCVKASPAEFFADVSNQSRRYDRTTDDLSRRGLPIIVTTKRKSTPTLSLDLQNMPLGEIIRQAAKAGRFSVTYTDTGVVIGDLDEATTQASPEKSDPLQPAVGSPAARARQRRNYGAVTTQTSPSTNVSEPGAGDVTDKARRIIFPTVRVENVSFDELIEFIRVKSRDLDPDKAGVQIFVKAGAPSDASITLDLKNIPLSELLSYVAELGRYNLGTDAKGYVLTSRS